MTAIDRNAAMSALPRAFHAFLGRFARLTAIQANAIPVVLAGEDCVLVAPAASGKTEAALAPLCERLTRNPADSGVGLLYLVPTRALANDTETRVRGPAGMLGLVATVRTGDRPAALAARRTDLLVTTPESLDSMLCRQAEVFGHVRAVVIDEAHQLDGTARGDQLRVLLRRLSAWHAKPRPQHVAMTATVADPEAMGLRLFGREVPAIRAGMERPVQVSWADDVADAARAIRTAGLTKAIFFCNSRRRTEQVGAELARVGPWPRERVMVHHGSLSRKEREEVEAAFRRFEAGLLVSTNTMELGVDIGDVDAVALVGSPDSLASFYQRVGRGCRRRTGMRAWCIPSDPEDAARFRDIVAALEQGEMPSVDHDPDLSVIVQQTFSVLYGMRRPVARRWLVELLKVLAEPPVVDQILDHLVAEGWLTSTALGGLVASTPLMDMGERGRIHSNIADSRTVKVVDDATGRVLGHVSAAAIDQGRVAMAGREWEVAGSARGTMRLAARTATGEGSALMFAPRLDVGAFARYLPPSLRTR